jgi:hypothetical protein
MQTLVLIQPFNTLMVQDVSFLTELEVDHTHAVTLVALYQCKDPLA